MSNSIPERLRLKDSHPVAKKVDQLYQLAEELGISFDFSGYRCILDVRDDNVEYLFEDLEAKSGSDEGNPRAFPPDTEWKITKENPKYAEAMKKEREVAKVRAKYERQVEAKRVEAKRKLQRETEEKRIKTQELKELTRLKRKYKND